MNPDPRLPLDHELDRQLRSAFTPPSDFDAVALASAAVRSGPRHESRRWPWLLAAAALLVTFAIGWLQRPASAPPADGEQLGSMWAAAYEHALADEAPREGQPRMCCDPSQDFGAACERRFAVKLAIGGQDVLLRGCYCGLPTGGCVAAMAETRDGPIGVFVVGRDRDPRPQLPAQSPLQLVRRELGGLVLYAVARRQQPSPEAALQRFELRP